MKTIMNWLLEPYMIGFSEFKYLIELKIKTESKAEKVRIGQLKYFNILFLAVYSVFLIGSLIFIVLSFILAWYGFIALIVTIPMMILAKAVQKRRYLNRRDAFIKGNPSLIKND